MLRADSAMRLLLSCALLLSVFSALPTKGYGASSTTCPCGSANKDKNEYPFVAGVIQFEKKLLCEGTIITPWHVLTAASCVRNWDDRDLSVTVGKTALKAPFEEIYEVRTRLMHKKYMSSDMLNDIAVLLTNKQIAFTQNVGAACLPASRLNLEGKTVTAIGWSKNVDVRAISFADCSKSWRKSRDNQPSKDTSMCTLEKNQEMCAIQAGSPLVWLDPDTDRYTLAAMVSFGRFCGDKAIPHTDVGGFLSWIVEQVSVSKPGSRICQKM